MIRILIAHETNLVRNALADVLRGEPDFRIVGLCSCAAEASTELDRVGCDLVLVNAKVPNSDTLTPIKSLVKKHEDVKVLVVCEIATTEFILRCFQAGACAYALNEDSLEDLVHKIRASHRGETLISPKMAGALVSRIAELSAFVNDVRSSSARYELLSPDLTPRELEVLTYVEQGCTNREIANALTIEVGTVKNHVHSILAKLEVGNRKQAAYLARQIFSSDQMDTDADEQSPVPVNGSLLSSSRTDARVPAI